MKKAIKMMMFVAAAAMLFVACDKEDEKPVTAGDNQMIYDGHTYELDRVSSSMEGNGVQFSCSKFGEAFIFEIDGFIDNLTASHTYDLTKVDNDHSLYFRIFLQSEDLSAENHIFDLRYQNAPELWYFLDDNEVSGASAFTKGTAVANIEANKLTLDVYGTLVNGKSISFRIVAPID